MTMASRGLLYMFFTGVVPPLPPKVVAQMRTLWDALPDDEAREAEYAAMKAAADARRASMTDNAARAGLLSGALVGGAAAVVALFQLGGAAKLLSLIAVALMLATICIVVLAASPKLKLWRARSVRVPTAITRLQAWWPAESAAKGDFSRDVRLDADEVRWLRYLAMANTKEKRDMLLFVERRAVSLASGGLVAGLVITLVGLLAAAVA